MDNKKIRGWILRILYRAYPAGLEKRSILKQLHDLGYAVTKRDFEANMGYLMDDNFIAEKKFGDVVYEELLSNKLDKITTAGIDLVEGVTTDCGVDV